MVKRILFLSAALLLSALLILSIPMLNLWAKEGKKGKEKKQSVAVEVKKLDLQKKEEPKKKPNRRPKRSKNNQRSLKSGPRFAMDLGVAGMGGVQLPADLINQRSGEGGGAQGDVDERPELSGGLNFALPSSIKEAEMNALLVLSFCVGPEGKAYNVKVMEERPAGMGLADAGKEALKQSNFSPAVKEGIPVAFCGMEQPIEVRFKD